LCFARRPNAWLASSLLVPTSISRKPALRAKSRLASARAAADAGHRPPPASRPIGLSGGRGAVSIDRPAAARAVRFTTTSPILNRLAVRERGRCVGRHLARFVDGGDDADRRSGGSLERGKPGRSGAAAGAAIRARPKAAQKPTQRLVGIVTVSSSTPLMLLASCPCSDTVMP
jgi:hypothetical protein